MPKSKRRTSSRLRKQALDLKDALGPLGDFVRGTPMLRQMTCGKPTCRCATGQGHPTLCLSYKEQGKTKTVYFPRTREAKLRRWAKNYTRLKALLEELSQINIELLRVKDKG